MYYLTYLYETLDIALIIEEHLVIFDWGLSTRIFKVMIRIFIRNLGMIKRIPPLIQNTLVLEVTNRGLLHIR